MGRGTLVASSHADTPQFIMRASFGEAAVASVCYASHRFVKILQGCPIGRYVRILFAKRRGQSGALDDRGISARGGHRWQG